MNLIIGNGKVAKHLSHRFQQLNIPFHSWSRAKSPKPSQQSFSDLLKTASKVYLAISDTAIFDFYTKHLKGRAKAEIFHFSGSYYFDEITGVHPLCAFSDNLDINWDNIHFSIDNNNYKLTDIFPHFKNTYSYINKEHKAYYHALCVISGNFSFLLWQKSLESFQQLGLPKAALEAYLQQTLANFLVNSNNLTGPLARDDKKTIYKNLQALVNHPLKDIYQSFLNLYTRGEMNEHSRIQKQKARR